MYASASTWMFNVVRQISSLHGVVQTDFLSGRSGLPAAISTSAVYLFKSHEISNPATVEDVAKRADKIIITIRDPRDAVTSMMLYHGYPFEGALGYVSAAARLCVRFVPDSRSLVLPYENRFFEDFETLAAVDRHLGYATAPEKRRAIFEGLRRDQVEKHIAKLPSLPGVLQDRVSGDLLDPDTHWHTHHAGRSGEIGRWKHLLTAEQVETVSERLEGCFRF
jgi:hypothetical protein